jgi:DNA polymerase-3 subunit gamma/tau
MSYQVLARRWRPLTFDAVVGQNPIVRTLKNALAQDKIAHAYLFAGPRGVGKTTTARLLAMGLNCEQPGGAAEVPCAGCEPCRDVIAGRALDVIEIDGASNRGIDEVRALRENARYAPARARRKVYIIDEVHMLTEPAFNALLKTLEEPPAHVIFVLATTEPRRLPATILSRCQRFDFRPIASGEIQAGLARILADESHSGGPEAEAEALALIARAADGSLRDALSLLDTALAYGEGVVTARAVRELLGSGGAEAARGLAVALVQRDAPTALARLDAAGAEGLDLGVLCQESMEVLRRVLLRRVASAPAEVPGDPDTEALTALPPAEADELLLLVKGLLDAEAEMRRSPHPRVDLEVAVIRLCRRPQPEAIEAVLERLERAEALFRGASPAAPAAPVQGDLLGEPAAPPTVPRPPPGRPSAAAPRPGVSRPVPPATPEAPPERVPGTVAAERGADATWREIVTEVTRVRPTLGHILGETVVVGEDAGRLAVSVPNGNAFAQDQVRNRDNRQLIVDVARRLSPTIRDVVFTAGEPDGTKSLLGHPSVRAAIELFDGEVTSVRATGASATPGRTESQEASRDSGEEP